MKVVHVPYCFYPDAVGGTEVYVSALAREQQRAGVRVYITAPAKEAGHYFHDGIEVRRFCIKQDVSDVSELYGEGDAAAAKAFGSILDEIKPDLIHLHALTRGSSLRMIRETHQRGGKVFLTYHTPTVSCQRGTLMFWGRGECDGVLDDGKCAGCKLHSLGLGTVLSRVIGSAPPGFGRVLARYGINGRAGTILRMRELIQRHHGTLRAVFAEVDGIIALNEWTRKVLARNAVDLRKVALVRHGIRRGDVSCVESRVTKGSCRFVCLGRLHPTKGVDVLLHAMSGIACSNIELHIYGIVQDGADETYLNYLRGIAADDSRIRFFPTVPPEEVISLLSRYDVTVIPSQWMETGPLVVLESFAAGTPVLASRLGGLEELVREGCDGILVEPASVEQWTLALKKLVETPDLVASLRAQIRTPRSMTQVCEETTAVYERVLSRS